jgi:hypothetical protein
VHKKDVAYVSEGTLYIFSLLLPEFRRESTKGDKMYAATLFWTMPQPAKLFLADCITDILQRV